jgi:hypothetical protein
MRSVVASIALIVSVSSCPIGKRDENFMTMLDSGVEQFASSPATHEVMRDLAEVFLAASDDRGPIALALFGKENTACDMAAQLVHSPGQTGVEFVDLEDMAQLSLPAAAQEIKNRIKAAVVACPHQSTVVFRSAELMQGERVQLLDVLLDPLNGDRPLIDNVDCSGLLVLLLMKTEVPVSSNWDWRGVLERHWEYEGVGFTAGAMAGRMTRAFSFPAIDADQQASLKGNFDKWSNQADMKLAQEPSAGGQGGAQMLGVVIALLAVAAAVFKPSSPIVPVPTRKGADVSPPKGGAKARRGKSPGRGTHSALGKQPMRAGATPGTGRKRSKTPVPKNK